jgi:hypothetical protein
MIKQKQVHILIGCADARDLNQLQLDAVSKVRGDFERQGIEIEYHVIRAAGSFVTPDVVMDIKRTVEQAQRNLTGPTQVDYFVHIQTHAHLTADSNDDYISHVHDLHVVQDSPLNCGMLGASGVGIEIEKMIVEEKPTLQLDAGPTVIDNDTKIKLMLKEHYAYDGYLAGDWIFSIDLLRTHPRHQRTLLEKAIENDMELRVLDIKITCGINDYSIHSMIRVDDGDPAAPFWDTVQKYIRDHSVNERTKKELLIQQSQKQKPYAGLLCMSDPRQSSRTLAARHYLKTHGINSGEYLPNTVFNMTGSSFDIPYTPFGPYVIAGFFYAVKHLKLTDQIVMGYDEPQTSRIMLKIKHDPIMNMIVNKFKVNLIPMNHADLEKG